MTPKEKAKRLYDNGWTFHRLCQMAETGCIVGLDFEIDAIAQELAELEQSEGTSYNVSVDVADVSEHQTAVPAIRIQSHRDRYLMLVLDASDEEAMLWMTRAEVEELRKKLMMILAVTA